MDATVNDFLNEINEIVPPVKKTDCDWQECFDDGSGFPYYWNVKSNEVTWEMPLQYQEWLESGVSAVKKVSLPPPKIEPLFPGVSLMTTPSSVKIYKIQEDTKATLPSLTKPTAVDQRKKIKPPRKKSSDSEDEKIILISSYGGDTESEEEDTALKKETAAHTSSPNSPKLQANSLPNSRGGSSSSEDEIDNTITAELTQLSGHTTLKDDRIVKKSAGFALVAGYGNDSEEEEEDHTDASNAAAEPDETESHSTLFPVTRPIDVSQFIESKPPEIVPVPEDIDTKAFQRKRRIAISLVNVPRRQKLENDASSEHKGLGFKNDHTNFKSGGISFIKSDTLYPTIEANSDSVKATADSNKDIDKATLKEKLVFLSEGKEAVSPVQIMLIQLETLYEALKAGSLDSGYLSKWIRETCEGLVKLEEDAAPNGWLLQWDRSQKRYYYRNKVTAECQWQYPQSLDDDAMDICTTPPPQNEDAIEEDTKKASGKPVTPPPPIISVGNKLDAPAKEETPASLQQTETVPPGTEESDKNPASSDLTSALDSFYSDIAAMENSNSSPVNVLKDAEQKDIPSTNTETAVTIIAEPPKKKKKVKMTTGISMKKKGVSKLVEKWKNVQKDLE